MLGYGRGLEPHVKQIWENIFFSVKEWFLTFRTDFFFNINWEKSQNSDFQIRIKNKNSKYIFHVKNRKSWQAYLLFLRGRPLCYELSSILMHIQSFANVKVVQGNTSTQQHTTRWPMSDKLYFVQGSRRDSVITNMYC